MKTCPLCNLSKSDIEFGKRKEGSYLSAYCKECKRTDPKIKAAAAVSRNKPESKLKKQAYQFKRKYGITLEEHQVLQTAQNNKCNICNVEFDKKICVDHDHITKKVRGLLCTNCNLALGLIKDNPLICDGMKEYLMRHS
jgi:hypothetical protein